MQNGHERHKSQIIIIIVSLIIGTFSLLAAGSFREFIDSVLQVSVPIGEKSLQGGMMLVGYRFCYFLILLAILVAVSVILV